MLDSRDHQCTGVEPLVGGTGQSALEQWRSDVGRMQNSGNIRAMALHEHPAQAHWVLPSTGSGGAATAAFEVRTARGHTDQFVEEGKRTLDEISTRKTNSEWCVYVSECRGASTHLYTGMPIRSDEHSPPPPPRAPRRQMMSGAAAAMRMWSACS